MRYNRLISNVGLPAERVVSAYKNRKVLVTGGLGFIGSNLALRLVRAGARVVIVDLEAPGCGANRHNIAAAAADLRVVAADVGDPAVGAEIRGCSAIFNLAGEISHVHSMRDPARDARLNAMAQLRFLEECARQAPGIPVVYASTRQIYGVPQTCRWMRLTPSGRWISTASTSTPLPPITCCGAKWGGSTQGSSA